MIWAGFWPTNPCAARNANVFARGWKWTRRQPTTAALVGAVALVVIVLVIGSIVSSVRLAQLAAKPKCSVKRPYLAGPKRNNGSKPCVTNSTPRISQPLTKPTNKTISCRCASFCNDTFPRRPTMTCAAFPGTCSTGCFTRNRSRCQDIKAKSTPCSMLPMAGTWLPAARTAPSDYGMPKTGLPWQFLPPTRAKPTASRSLRTDRSWPAWAMTGWCTCGMSRLPSANRRTASSTSSRKNPWPI